MVITLLTKSGDLLALTRAKLLALYQPADVSQWKSISELADELGVGTCQLRRAFRELGIKPRTPKENWKRIVWCMRQRGNSEHYSCLERVAKEVLDELGLRYCHNYLIGRASIDFYFPEKARGLEIDSVWHTSQWRAYDRARADRKRDRYLRERYGIKIARTRLDDTKDRRVQRRRVLNALRRLELIP